MLVRHYRDSTAKGRPLQLSSRPALFPFWRTADRPAPLTTSSCRRTERLTQTGEKDSWVSRPGRATPASGRAGRSWHHDIIIMLHGMVLFFSDWCFPAARAHCVAFGLFLTEHLLPVSISSTSPLVILTFQCFHSCWRNIYLPFLVTWMWQFTSQGKRLIARVIKRNWANTTFLTGEQIITVCTSWACNAALNHECM